MQPVISFHLSVTFAVRLHKYMMILDSLFCMGLIMQFKRLYRISPQPLIKEGCGEIEDVSSRFQSYTITQVTYNYLLPSFKRIAIIIIA